MTGMQSGIKNARDVYKDEGIEKASRTSSDGSGTPLYASCIASNLDTGS